MPYKPKYKNLYKKIVFIDTNNVATLECGHKILKKRYKSKGFICEVCNPNQLDRLKDQLIQTRLERFKKDKFNKGKILVEDRCKETSIHGNRCIVRGEHQYHKFHKPRQGIMPT